MVTIDGEFTQVKSILAIFCTPFCEKMSSLLPSIAMLSIRCININQSIHFVCVWVCVCFCIFYAVYGMQNIYADISTLYDTMKNEIWTRV